MKEKDLLKQSYITCANSLGMGDFTHIKTGADRAKLITEIADKYCEATDTKNENLRNCYISALMLLFWGEIKKMSEKCKAVKELEYEDFATKLYECIEIACQYRAWKTDKHNAEQCIRATIASRGTAAILYESNLDKNKANINKTELDATVDKSAETETSRLDMLEDEHANDHIAELAATTFIQSIIDKGDLIAGILFDNIAFNDCQKETKIKKVGIDLESGEEYTYTASSLEFSEHYLVKVLSHLPQSYKEYFLNKYTVKEAAVEAALERIRSVNNTKLYKFIRDTLAKQKTALQA